MSLSHRTRNAAPPVQARQILVPRHIAPGQRSSRNVQHTVRYLDGLTMGTTWGVKIVAARHQPLHEIKLGIQAQLDRVVAQMSTWLQASTISRYNMAAAGSWHIIEPEFFTVLTAALEVARSTGGAYDPTIGEMVALWGFGPQAFEGTRPSPQQVEASVSRSGWQKVSIEPATRRIFQPGGVELDLSSIAKGFGVDQVAAFLKQKGFSDFLVEVGGELRGAGCKPDGTPWWVVLEVPDDVPPLNTRISETLLALHGVSIATSGDYRRRVFIGDEIFSHTIDPLSGMPISGSLASVSVISSECMMADALATALFALGPEAGKAYAERHHIAARFLTRTETGLRQTMTPAMTTMLF